MVAPLPGVPHSPTKRLWHVALVEGVHACSLKILNDDTPLKASAMNVMQFLLHYHTFAVAAIQASAGDA